MNGLDDIGLTMEKKASIDATRQRQRPRAPGPDPALASCRSDCKKRGVEARCMRPEIVTFWHGPLDRLRLTCLRSQVAAGHKVTVYSFEPLAQLPDGVGNAEAEAILPHAFSEKLRPPQPDGSWRDWTTLQFTDFFRMRLMAQQRRPVARRRRAAAQAGRDRSGKALFRLGAAAPARQFGALSAARRSDRRGVRRPDGAGRIDAGLAGAAASPDFRVAQAARRIEPALGHSRRDLRSGGADRARPPQPANCITPCRRNHFTRFMPNQNCSSSPGFFGADRRSRNHRAAHFTERPRQPASPLPAAWRTCMGVREVRKQDCFVAVAPAQSNAPSPRRKGGINSPSPRSRRRSQWCAGHVGVQPLHHLAIELDRAARGVFRLLERRDDLAGVRDFLGRRREDRVAGLDLAGMDQRLAVEAEIARLARIPAQSRRNC